MTCLKPQATTGEITCKLHGHTEAACLPLLRSILAHNSYGPNHPQLQVQGLPARSLPRPGRGGQHKAKS